MNKLIISERQLNLITKNLVMEQDNELIAYCDCVDGTIQFACDDCEMCCVDNGGWDNGVGTTAQIVGMGDVSYSYDDGPIETSNASSSFGYTPPPN